MTDSPFSTVLLAIHSTAGILSLLGGAMAMANRKGSDRHRGWGSLFFISMITLTTTGTYMALFLRPIMGNVMGSAFPLYLTATAWLTVRREPGKVGRLEVAALSWGIIVVVAGVIFGRMALDHPRGSLDGFPATFYFIIAGLVSLGVAFDMRMIIRGGLAGTARTTRHLIRMCSALLVLTAAFFSGRATDFPVVVRDSGVLSIPIVIVLALFVYWLVRVRMLPVIRRFLSKRAAGVPSPAAS